MKIELFFNCIEDFDRTIAEETLKDCLESEDILVDECQIEFEDGCDDEESHNVHVKLELSSSKSREEIIELLSYGSPLIDTFGENADEII